MWRLTRGNHRIIHSFLFFSYFTRVNKSGPSFNENRRLRRPRENHKPRLVALPSGTAMMVTPHNQPMPPAFARTSPVEMSRMGPRIATSGTNESIRNQRTGLGRIPGSGIPAMSQSAPLVATEAPTTTGPGSRPKQDIPRRRPVASSSLVPAPADTISAIPSMGGVSHVETKYNTPPPGPDYQPDEAELQRAARGEAQAQWVPRHLMGL